jgi:putative lipoic acid-binding regulatory protein
VSEPAEELLSFPCRYPIKAMGETTTDVKALLLAILAEHSATPHPDDVVYRHSGAGKYVSVTATIHATSRAQLESIYTRLRQDSRIRFLL